MKRIRTIIFTVVMVASVSSAGWFTKSEKVTEVKPAVGYTETKELVTNSWGGAVSLSKDPARLVAKEAGYATLYIANCITTTNNIITYSSSSYSPHECPKCTEEHISDYPKSKTIVNGVQYKVTTTYYKDGEVDHVMEHYTYPHEKKTLTITTSLEKKKEYKTVIEKTK